MPQKIENLNKDQLRSLADSNQVDYDDDTTNATMIERLHEKGVTHAQTQEESDEAAQQRSEAVASSEGGFAGGTAGGASESQQPTAGQADALDEAAAERDADAEDGGDEGARASEAPASDEVELPELDAEVAAGVYPRAATPPNPALEYDDDLKAQEGEEGVDPAASRERREESVDEEE
jgi:hypothetical protein